MEDYTVQVIKEVFSESERAKRKQEAWLNKFNEIITKLKDKSVKVGICDKVVTPEWVEKVYSYLKQGSRESWINISDNQTFIRINTERFYALQYFLHEVFEILLKENGEGNDESHAKSLVAEYQFLESIAKASGYKTSSGTLFNIHPLFSSGDGLHARYNDIKLLNKIGMKFRCVSSEINEAQKFFKELGRL